MSDMELPIALRKPKRRNSVLSSPAKPRVAPYGDVEAKTPATRRSKRVRFSDPGLFSSPSRAATSLTPAFRRSSLATPKQRRPGTPARPAIEGSIQFTPFTQILDERCQRRIRRNGLSEELNSYESERKARTTLQKELNEKELELQHLRTELEVTKNKQLQPPESYQLPSSSQQRVDEVEAELEALRQSFSATEDDNATQVDPISWDHIVHATGPSSDGGDTILIHEDDDADAFANCHRQPSNRVIDSDALSMGLELEAARQAKSTLLGSFRDQTTNTSFDLNFADTPDRQQRSTVSYGQTFRLPDTPRSFHHDISKRLKEATSRAEEAELALTALDIEITSIGFGSSEKDDTMAMVTAIADHFRSARLELEHLVPGETSAGFENASVLPEILKKTRLLSDKLKAKENELKSSKDQHHNLKNNFEKAIMAAEKANDQVRKLESALDKNVEDTLHVRMRSQQLEQDLAEKEKDVTSLSNALNRYRNDITRLESLIDDIQQENELSHQTSSQVSEKVEILEARVTAETNGRRAAEISAVQRLARINELEAALATSKRHASDLETRLNSLQSSDLSSSQHHTEEILALNSRISSLATALASANAEVEKLKISKNKLEERVRSEVEQGAKAVETLQEQLIRTVMKGNEARKRYVNGAKIRIANWELDDDREMSSDGPGSEDGGLRTPSSVVQFAEWAEVETFDRNDPHQSRELDEDQRMAEESGSESVPGSVEYQRGRGKYRKVPKLVSNDRRAGLGIEQATDVKRGKRRYDSGIGMGSDSDFEVYDETRGAGEVRNGILTPELSSDTGDAELEREMIDTVH